MASEDFSFHEASVLASNSRNSLHPLYIPSSFSTINRNTSIIPTPTPPVLPQPYSHFYNPKPTSPSPPSSPYSSQHQPILINSNGQLPPSSNSNNRDFLTCIQPTNSNSQSSPINILQQIQHIFQPFNLDPVLTAQLTQLFLNLLINGGNTPAQHSSMES